MLCVCVQTEELDVAQLRFSNKSFLTEMLGSAFLDRICSTENPWVITAQNQSPAFCSWMSAELKKMRAVQVENESQRTDVMMDRQSWSLPHGAQSKRDLLYLLLAQVKEGGNSKEGLLFHSDGKIESFPGFLLDLLQCFLGWERYATHTHKYGRTSFAHR